MTSCLKNKYEIGRYLLIKKIVSKYISNHIPKDSPIIADLGAGDLRYSKMMKRFFPHSEIYAVDMYFPRKLLKNAKVVNIKMIEADLEYRIDLPSQFFDLVLALEIIEHIKNYRLFISEIYRILKKGGVLLLSTPNSSSIEALKYKLFYDKEWNAGDPTHLKIFSIEEIYRLLRKKFKIIDYFGYKAISFKDILLPPETNLCISKLFRIIFQDTIFLVRK